MADGNRQTEFHMPFKSLVSALRPGEIVIDFFAGGGGASEALEQALGRPVDLAVNHDEFAIGMHAANHPFTRHLREDVWQVSPRREVGTVPVGWFHASPDCTHFSQARGGQPRSRKTRALSWVVVKWVGSLRKSGNAPRLISLENVEQILKWGPLVAKRDKATGRVVTLDQIPDPSPGAKPGGWVYRVAEPGERVPVELQQLVPDKRREGRTWSQFVAILRGHGYAVDWKKLIASEYGAGTSRKRLFMISRNDGEPICQPERTHGAGLLPMVTAADCIDWSIPCPSIFTRKKPLADATHRRIARGIKRYVLDAAEPFIVGGIAPVLTEHANSSGARAWSADEPLQTQCAQVKGGHFAVIAPSLVQAGHGEGSGATKRRSYGINDIQGPVGTIVASGGGHAVAAAHLVKFRGDSLGSSAAEPVPTITSGAGAARPAGAAHALGVVTAFLEQANGGGPNGNPARARGAEEPVSAITGTGSQQRLVTAGLVTASPPCQHFASDVYGLTPEHEAGALRVAGFLVNYYGNGQPLDVREPMDTVTTRDRLALVTVTIKGTPYVIVDIGLRMLQRHELFKAQGFPADYIIDRTADGRRLNVSQSVRMVGNSVSPPPLVALIRANLPSLEPMRAAA